MRRMSKIFLDLYCLIFGCKGAAGEGCFESLTEWVACLQRNEQEEGLVVDTSVVDGVFKAMDGQVDWRAAHFGETRLLDLLPFGDSVAHDVAGRGLLVNGQD